MNKLIYCYDEETYKRLLKDGLTLLKEDFKKGEFIFVNNKPITCFDEISTKVRFSSRMSF